MQFNGAFGAAQLAWLDAQLMAAEAAAERVLVATHVPLCAGSCDPMCLLWNHEAVLAVLHAHGSTCVATVTGHDHPGGYARDGRGIHHLVCPAVVEAPPGSNGFATIDVHADRLVVRGTGTFPSYELPFA